MNLKNTKRLLASKAQLPHTESHANFVFHALQSSKQIKADLQFKAALSLHRADHYVQVLTSFSACCCVESAFLADLAAQDMNATFCSPLLVNAMCAVGAVGVRISPEACVVTLISGFQFTSRYAEALDNLALDDKRLRERFFKEAQRLLENERGKPSLTTMQALFLLYTYTSLAAMGKDIYSHSPTTSLGSSRLDIGLHLRDAADVLQIVLDAYFV